MKKQKKKSCVIALVGKPNVGKSSLLNALIGERISIVTHKVQTTRSNIRGILNIQNTQLIFIDTPGLFKAARPLEKALVKNAVRSFDEANIICVLFDVKKLALDSLEPLKNYLKTSKKKCYAILNKIDVIEKSKLLEITKQLSSEHLFEEIFMLSALKGDGLEHFKEFLVKKAKVGEWLFDEDQLTDVPMRSIAEEITREQAFLLLHNELPYSLKIETDNWEEKKGDSVKIHQTLFVLKESQKIIALGKQGIKIKEISRRSRLRIEKLIGKKTHLFLHVKVANWIERDFSV